MTREFTEGQFFEVRMADHMRHMEILKAEALAREMYQSGDFQLGECLANLVKRAQRGSGEAYSHMRSMVQDYHKPH